jgi:ABC-type phosphate/phosphonate transport system permease subunit
VPDLVRALIFVVAVGLDPFRRRARPDGGHDDGGHDRLRGALLRRPSASVLAILIPVLAVEQASGALHRRIIG